MSIMNTMSKMEIPNIEEVIKSARKTKSKMQNMNVNKVDVHFLYSDGRFKQTVEGSMMHIAEIPIVLISEPAKLGFLIMENTLVYDVTKQTFEIFVSEDFSHSISLSVLDDYLEIDEKLKSLINNNEFIVPTAVNQLKKYKTVVKHEEEEIKLLPSFLSSLGRAKLLENTTQSSNDGLIIVGIIGILIGIIIGGIGVTMFVI